MNIIKEFWGFAVMLTTTFIMMFLLYRAAAIIFTEESMRPLQTTIVLLWLGALGCAFLVKHPLLTGIAVASVVFISSVDTPPVVKKLKPLKLSYFFYTIRLLVVSTGLLSILFVGHSYHFHLFIFWWCTSLLQKIPIVHGAIPLNFFWACLLKLILCIFSVLAIWLIFWLVFLVALWLDENFRR